MKKCIIPGSYDPVTAGHIDLFKSASRLFDEVYPIILINAEKQGGMFTYDERAEILDCAVSSLREEGYGNIIPVKYSGLTSSCADDLGAEYIVKGVRNSVDFAYEYDLSEIMRRFAPSLTTVMLPSRAELSCVSSTYVRELIKYGKFDSSDFAAGTVEVIKRIITERKLLEP